LEIANVIGDALLELSNQGFTNETKGFQRIFIGDSSFVYRYRQELATQPAAAQLMSVTR
jgi:hypothetical protein